MEYSEKWPEITKNTPLEEVLEIHRRIWDEVIADPECKKPETPYHQDCAMCEYVCIHELKCVECPINWEREIYENPGKCVRLCGCCTVEVSSTFEESLYYPGLYELFRRSTIEKKLEYAKIIRDLPLKKMYQS